MHTDDRHSVVPSETEHLSDDQLLEIRFPVTSELHLAGCEACHSRYDGLVRELDFIREEAAQEADAVFTAERLASQRDAIMRRLDRATHHADVVTFPGRRTGTPGAWAPHPSRRWVAAAAAAGLVTGLLVGRYADVRSHSGAPTSASAMASVAPRRATQPAGVISRPTDDQFLVEIEDAVTSRRIAELQALDALTSPELREISLDGSP
jgi:hypothetical protein